MVLCSGLQTESELALTGEPFSPSDFHQSKRFLKVCVNSVKHACFTSKSFRCSASLSLSGINKGIFACLAQREYCNDYHDEGLRLVVSVFVRGRRWTRGLLMSGYQGYVSVNSAELSTECRGLHGYHSNSVNAYLSDETK